MTVTQRSRRIGIVASVIIAGVLLGVGNLVVKEAQHQMKLERARVALEWSESQVLCHDYNVRMALQQRPPFDCSPIERQAEITAANVD